ncbi:MAG: glycoside hydrolase family 127 protein [Oscillospiraceae bacterium]|jgi:DUF1680 family protein|nr:glycoside hydrolase family 127 protein [Oscillospiraceae bacterium]
MENKNAFWSSILENVRAKMIPFQLAALKDEIPNAEPSHAIRNFEIAAGVAEGEYHGMVFQDSDVGKWIEAAAYSLTQKSDAKLESEIDYIISVMAKAQLADGYLNTYFILKEPDGRRTNLRECHEMYCAGHLIEGAVAYFDATGKREFLDVMTRFADHIYEEFGPGKKAGYPGHPELELALYKLYHATGEAKYARLADLFIDRRGTEPNYLVSENERNKGRYHWGGLDSLEYTQAHKPLREQDRAVGHAVRAMYLYAGAADSALSRNDAELSAALFRLWDNVTKKQMYVTGGFGATRHGEAFAEDYELPNDTVYAETCASVAFVFWARRMLKLKRSGKIADDMERALYNTVLAGSNLNMDRYFYVNPLEALPCISGESPDYKHVLPERPPWFGCACCPPNMARLLLSINDYAYTFADGKLDIHLYVDGTVTRGGTTVTHSGDYPWGGSLNWTIECDSDTDVSVRVPSWSKENTLTVDGTEANIVVNDGYAGFRLSKGAHTVNLSIEIKPRRVYANPKVRADSNCAALMTGPLVYCLEGADNPSPLCALRLADDTALHAEVIREGVLDGMTAIKADGKRLNPRDELYTEEPAESTAQTLTFIPYFAWGNRGRTEMRVWINI